MNNQKSSNMLFKQLLLEHMQNDHELNIKDIYDLFPNINPKTVSWRLYELVRAGVLEKPRHGYYAIMRKHDDLVVHYDYLQERSKKVYNILVNYGYEFLISGLDALITEVLHVPEEYPTLLAVEPAGVETVQKALSDNGLIVISEKERSIYKSESIRSKIDVLIFIGVDVPLSGEHVAPKEIGFVDLYYAVTRLEYTVSIPELLRIYQNLLRNNTIITSRLLKASITRGVHTEIDWLVDMEKAPKKTLEFMKYRIGDLL